MTRLFAQLQILTCDNPTDNRTALCKIASQCAEMGDYETAIRVLQSAKEFSTPATDKTLNQVALQICHQWNLDLGRLQIAESIGVQLHAVCSAPGACIHSKIDSKFRYVQLLLEKADFTGATNILNQLIQLCLDKGLEIYTVSLHLTQAEIHVASGSLVTALPFTLSSIALSERYNLISLGASAKVLRAEIELALGKPAPQIHALLFSVYPTILHHCPVSVSATASIILAKIAISQQNPEEANEFLCCAEESMEKLTNLSKLQTLCYQISMVYDSLSNLQKRDFYANQFKQIDEQKSSVRGDLDSQFYYLDFLNE